MQILFIGKTILVHCYETNRAKANIAAESAKNIYRYLERKTLRQ